LHHAGTNAGAGILARAPAKIETHRFYTGPRNHSIDVGAAAKRGISITHTGYTSAPTIELTWALILASARHISSEFASVRFGSWQHTLGDDLAGKTLGVVGLGNVGSGVAKVGLAFGMKVIAWSQNLTSDAAKEIGAHLVSKEELLRTADVISIHMVLSPRTIGLIGAAEFALMKPSVRLVNTSRGPLVVEKALLAALAERRIAGAAIDVYDVEPLPKHHPYRFANNLLATPHIGYVTRGLYERFYRDSVSNIAAWLDQMHTNSHGTKRRERQGEGRQRPVACIHAGPIHGSRSRGQRRQS